MRIAMAIMLVVLTACSAEEAEPTHPHLHFGVYQYWPPNEGDDMPVNFRNASGQHDSLRGLASWWLFKALPVN